MSYANQEMAHRARRGKLPPLLLSVNQVEKLTEFFATDQIEASARRTQFVQRASKITGKRFLALVTFGPLEYGENDGSAIRGESGAA